MTKKVVIHHLFLSPGHNFQGRHGKSPGDSPIIAKDALHCLAGRGIEGDRFFDHRPDFKGQITFFDLKVHQALEAHLGRSFLPSAYRRNVVVEGLELLTWIGKTFRMGGVVFEGTEEARPCYWMNTACGEGAEEWLRGRGGLRARIVNSGFLERGQVQISEISSGPKGASVG
ncbi:MAG: MOSC domain-containing protein [Verrucomicrobiota bacterium]